MGTNPIHKLSAKRQRYVKALTEGVSKKEAALAAGYAPSTAAAGNLDTPDVQAAFKYAMRNRIRVDRIAQRIDEGMDAMATKFFAHNGVVMDSRETIDFAERRHYAQLAAEMAGYWSPKQEVDVVQRIDETTARRLADIAEKMGLTDMEWEERQQLRASYVVLDGQSEISDDTDSDKADTPEVANDTDSDNTNGDEGSDDYDKETD